jgi:DNA modification methylase
MAAFPKRIDFTGRENRKGEERSNGVCAYHLREMVDGSVVNSGYIGLNKMRTNFETGSEELALLVGDLTPTSRKSVSAIAGIEVFAQNRALLQELAAENQASPINGFASLVNYAPNADKPIHRWFWYREGFSLELVQEFIKNLPKGSTVLDPFCGAGTTLLAARDLGYPSIGLDVNPISILVSRVKTTPVPTSVSDCIPKFLERMQRARADMAADEKPALSIIDKVFEPGILRALLVFRRIVKSIESPQIRDLFFVAWLSILERVSNVYKEGNGIKYKNRRRSGSGYIHLDLNSWQTAVFPKDKFAYVKKSLLDQIKMMIEDLGVMPSTHANSRIIDGEAETLATHIHANSVAMTIFSPPYCNCFNYFKMYKIELWMGEFVKTYAELRTLNRRGLRSHVETVLRRVGDAIEPESERFARLLDGLELWDKRIPRAVRGYFIDMSRVLSQLYEVLKPEGKCIIVVGNSSYGGVVIPTDSLLAQIGVRIGFRVEKLAVARHLTTSSQQRAALGDRMAFLRESLLVLVKDDPRHRIAKLEVITEIPNQDYLRRGKLFLIRNSGLTAATNKFHRYPGKFIPHIPRWAINHFVVGSRDKLVLDPFCGSGTTLVEASLVGLDSYGIDVDPIARLVTTVKNRPIDPAHLEKSINGLTKAITQSSRGRIRPEIPTLNHWFSDSAVKELSILRTAIERFREDRPVYEFFIVCFTAIIRRVSNADNQTQKTYVSHTKKKIVPAAIPLFLETLSDYSKRLIQLSLVKPLGAARMLAATDSRNFSADWHSARLPLVDLIISSPPYLNAVDYVYNQMAEYFWIGDLFNMETQLKQNEYKRNYIGTSKIDAVTYRKTPVTSIVAVDLVVQSIVKKSLKNAFIVGQYFLDMVSHFREAAKVLKPGAPYVCVVGDSLVSGEPIEVHKLVAECAKAAGFKVAGSFGYEIRNRHMRFPRMGRGGIVKYDWVLELYAGRD